MIVAGLVLTPCLSEAKQLIATNSRESEILALITEYVGQKSDSVAETRVKRVTFTGLSRLPPGKLEYELVAPAKWDGWGTSGIAVIVRQGNRIVGNILARVEVAALAEMVVAVRAIPNGTLISDSDLALRKQDLATTNGRYLTKIEDVVGKKSRSNIRPNVPVKPEQLEKVPLIKSGQLVTIMLETEWIRITVRGKAKNSGAAGDTIIVQNLNSLKDIPARVRDASTVVVAF